MEVRRGVSPKFSMHRPFVGLPRSSVLRTDENDEATPINVQALYNTHDLAGAPWF